MAIQTVEAKVLYDLGIIYDAEHTFLEALRMMAENAQNPALGKLLGKHATETQEQIDTFSEIYAALGQSPASGTSEAAARLVASTQKAMEDAADNLNIRDYVIADAALQAEHYEIASYCALVTGAQQMGNTHALRLLQIILQQEETTAEILELNMQPILERVALGESGIPLLATAPAQSMNM